MTLLDHDVGDARPVILLQTDASLPDGYQLWPRDLTQPKNRQTKCLLDFLIGSYVQARFVATSFNQGFDSLLP